MEPRSFRHTSIFATEVSRLHDPDLHRFPDFCLYDHPAIEAIKGRQSPVYLVSLTRLEPSVRLYSDAQMKNTVACSTNISECVLAEVPIYDTRHLGQLMCVGVGRFPHNLLRPFLGDAPDAYYDHPEVFDPEATCAQISRDHGLVFYSAEGALCFRDFGTKKNGRRAGSKNGTWIDGEQPIQDVVIRWSASSYLGIGGRIQVSGPAGTVKEHVFKLRCEAVGSEDWVHPIEAKATDSRPDE